MNLIKQFIDLNIKNNQLLVAQNWTVYQYKIIISEEIRFKIEQLIYDYEDGMITNVNLSNNILYILDSEFNAQNN